VVLLNGDAVLKRFKNTRLNENEGVKIEPEGSKSIWIQLRRLFDDAARDKTNESTRKLSRSIHSLQVQNL
jgi:hypothetical protein